jgi:hypothetical protein
MTTKPSMTKSKAAQQRKTHKWADFQKEADRRAEGRGATPRPSVEPFVIDDVQPPIIIPQPDEKTSLIIGEQIGMLSNDLLNPKVSLQRILPLLRAFCGDQFPRIWAMLPEENTTENVYILMQALLDHFSEQMAVFQHAQEAADLPGGSRASSAS